MARHRYQLHGLSIDSSLALPELLRDEGGATADVVIDQADTLPPLTYAHALGPNAVYADGCYQLTVPEVARYHVTAGHQILVQARNSAAAHDVRLYLLGTAMAAILHQRQWLPLHVGAVITHSGAWAFTGPSGAGKSTLVAALNQQGYPMLTDDVAVVRHAADGPLLWPGFPRLKLWRDALSHFQLEDQPLILDHTRSDKFHLPLHDGFHQRPIPLTALCLLERAEPGEAATLERVDTLSAVQAVVAATYRPKLTALGSVGAHFQQCALVAKHISVYRYRRAWGLATLNTQLTALRQLMPPAPSPT